MQFAILLPALLSTTHLPSAPPCALIHNGSPVAALLMAARMVMHEGCHSVAVVAGDTPGSASLEAFLARADAACCPPAAAVSEASSSSSTAAAAAAAGGGGGSAAAGQPHRSSTGQSSSTSGRHLDGQQPAGWLDGAPSPVIPHLYDRIAQWQMKRHGVTREQLVSRLHCRDSSGSEREREPAACCLLSAA